MADTEAGAQQDPVALAVGDGYEFEGPALELGGLMLDATRLADVPIRIPLGMLNRHGLVAGATGTGKTKTLQLLAEQLSVERRARSSLRTSRATCPASAVPGGRTTRSPSEPRRWASSGRPRGFPVELYALGGEGTGVPLRVTMSSFGPLLLSKVLGLNDTQESSLGLVFHYADKAGLPLLDLADLRAVVQHLTSDEGKPELKALGGLSSATAGVILRELIAFSDQGADAFFGEPEFETSDLLQTTDDGRGLISLVELPNLQDRPAIFSTFLMWLLADLFHDLPEIGDVDKPTLVFFFDEAHLLFADASDAFLGQVAQTVRLIRSKGVGVFFVTQSPTDVPDDVLAQLGSRVQHQLRAHTPNDAKALEGHRQHLPEERVRRPRRGAHQPRHRRGRRDRDERAGSPDAGGLDAAAGRPSPGWVRQIPRRWRRSSPSSPRQAKYSEVVDRESAHEKLAARLEQGARQAESAPAPARPAKKATAKKAPKPRNARRRQSGARTSSSPAPSRTSCAPPPARSRAVCSRRAGVRDERVHDDPRADPAAEVPLPPHARHQAVGRLRGLLPPRRATA